MLFSNGSNYFIRKKSSWKNYIQLGLFNDRIGNSYKFYFPIAVDNRPDNNEAGYSIDF
jgi:hypothetical protein